MVEKGCYWACVYEFEDVVKRLQENKVEFFKKPTEESFGMHTIIKDPDNNLISIAQIKRKPHWRVRFFETTWCRLIIVK
jgi:hypothetical protein